MTAKMPDLTRTAAVLEEYDAGAEERDALFNATTSMRGHDRWLAAVDAAEKKLRRAYLEDTADRNNVESCMKAGVPDIGFIRAMVELWRKERGGA